MKKVYFVDEKEANKILNCLQEIIQKSGLIKQNDLCNSEIIHYAQDIKIEANKIKNIFQVQTLI